MNINFPDLSYKIDELSIIMMALIGYIGTCVTVFASCYMKGVMQNIIRFFSALYN